MPGYDAWKTRSPDDDISSEDPSQEQQQADYEDEMQQSAVMDDVQQIVDWLRNAPSTEWCAPPLNKAADLIERLSRSASSETPEIYREIWRRRLFQTMRGYTAEHDDQHADGSIADAAACYASPNAPLKLWPWRNAPPNHADRRSRLIDAAALCIAEIERLDRATLSRS